MAAHEIYARELGQLQHGEALWVPEPNGYDEARVGDVGYIANGVFNKLFNVIAAADDPINLGFEVPDDFEPLVLRPNTLYKNDNFFRPGVYHGYSISRFDIGASITGSASVGTGIQFQASDTQGALLFLRRKALREDVNHARRKVFEDYIREHYKSWYAYARQQDLEFPHGQIMLVTGCDKTAEWDSAVFSSNSKGAGITLFGGLPTVVSGELSISSARESGTSVQCRSGPVCESESTLKYDQTIFIRGYRVCERQFFGPKIIKAAAEPRSPEPEDRHSDEEFILVDEGHLNYADLIVESIPSDRQESHPACALLKYVFEHSDAPVAFVHSDDWCGTGLEDRTTIPIALNECDSRSEERPSASPKSTTTPTPTPDDNKSEELSAIRTALSPFPSRTSRLGSLSRFPAEVLEDIALEVVFLERLGPPKGLIPLLCTCRQVHNILAFDQCPNLYARIFKVKFDVSAVRRRFRPKSIYPTNLAFQLRKYCINLQDIRRGDIYSPRIHDILRTAFLMAYENDGKNAYQLEWAGLDVFVDHVVRARLNKDTARLNGWPAESSINALALWLMWFMTTPERLAAESVEQHQQITDTILPYIMLPCRYPSAYAPPNHFDFPLSEKFGQRFPYSVVTAHGPYPPYREPHLFLQVVEHFGHFLEFSPPLISIAAKMLYFSRREIVPLGIPTHLPIDRAHAMSLGLTHVQPTQADIHEVNTHQSVKIAQRPPWDYMTNTSDEETQLMDRGVWTPNLTSASGKWDNDWIRTTFCYDPWHRMPLKGTTYTHGILNGLWQGRMLVPTEADYMDLIKTPHRPSSFAEERLRVTIVPLFMRLREHHCINPHHPIGIGGKRNGFDDGLENAWLPPARMLEEDGKITVTDNHGRISIYNTYVPGQPNSHREETCTACISDKGNAKEDMCRHSGSLSDSELPTIPPIDSEIEDIFASCGLGQDDNVDNDMDSISSDNDDSDADEVIVKSCSGIQDLLLTGETDFSHGQAWHHYIFYGRVRGWDGLIALVRVPRHFDGLEHRYLGRWVFTGYVVGAQNFVGTWRATSGQDVGVPTWESAFSVSRRD